MIKKILTALFCLVLIAPTQSVGASLKITDVKAFQKILEKHFPENPEMQSRIATSYANSAQKKDYKNAGWNMCVAGGIESGLMRAASTMVEKFAAKTTGGLVPTTKCKDFIGDIAWGATGLYYQLCGVEDRKHITGQTKCVRSFYEFQGQISSAVAMAQEFARLSTKNPFKDSDTIVCQSSYRTSGNDDYIKCKSIKTRRFYEFQFDDVRESFDSTIRSSIKRHIWWLHGLTWEKGKYATREKCNQVHQTAQLFNAKAEYRFNGKQNVCSLSFNDKTSASQLRSACGIDPFVFSIGDDIQINQTLEISAQLRGYVAEKCAVDQSIVTCTSNAASYIGDGGNYGNSLIFDSGDDVLTCSYSQYDAATKKTKLVYIDFVFDDVTEFSKKRVNAGNQAMGCVVLGGTYNGKECMHLTKEQCLKINENMAKNCSNCKKATWDATNQMCVLPDSATMSERDDVINATLLVVGTAAAVAITVVTGGTGAPVLAVVLIETTGAVIEGVATHQINEALDEFFVRSNKCKDAKCAEALIKEGMERIVDFANDMSDGQVNGFDKEMARLFGLIPEDSEFFQTLLENYAKEQGVDLTVYGNKLSMFDANSWQPEQVWRAIGITMQLTSVFVSLGNWLFKGGKATTTVLNQTDNVVRQRLTRAQAKNLDDWADHIARLDRQRHSAPLKHRRAVELGSRYKNINQKRNTLLKSLGLQKGAQDDLIKLLQREAYLTEDVAKYADDVVKAQQRADHLYQTNKNGQQVFRHGVSKHSAAEALRNLETANKNLDDAMRNLEDVSKQLDDIYGVGKTTVTTVVTPGVDDVARQGYKNAAIADAAILEARNQAYKMGMPDISEKPAVGDGVSYVDTPDPEFDDDIKIEDEEMDVEDVVIATDDNLKAEYMTPQSTSGGGNNTSTPEQKKSGAVIVGTGTAEKQVPQSTSGANNTSAPELVWDSDVEIEDEEIVVEDPVFDFSNDNLNVGKVSAPSTKSDAKKVKPHAVKDPRKTGLIATAAVLGAVGTGLLVGGLVSRDKDDDKKASSAQSAKNTALERELETILNNSNTSLGFVNGNMIKLVPMATVENTQAKIVNINANAVVVVDYRGHNIPFYANSSSSSWVPVLGIGVNGGWFNVYPTSVLPGFVVQIQNLLNQKLNPGTVGQFVVANALGVQFPIPTAAAYNVINAEFPKGVVQKYTTPMSAADKTLYDNNYNRMKKLS